jgi:hypothetical protein
MLAGALAVTAGGAQAQQRGAVAVPVAEPTYADVAGLAEAADIVALVEVRGQTLVKPERAPGLMPGHARLYIKARTLALLAGRSAVGESLVYLADVPLLPNGKVPKLKKQRFLVFADPVAGRPGELSLVGPAAQVPATPGSEQLSRTVIAALAAPDAPPSVGRVREAMSVAGNLAGESETQVFLDTTTGMPVSLSVVRRPGMEPQWGVSWSEIVDQSARPPAPESVEWYRLACFLPRQLPADALIQQDRSSRAQAEADYGYILVQLGECTRTLG